MAGSVSDRNARDSLAAIELLVLDVDGVLTDGRFALDADGREIKTFHTQDGFGLRQLQDAGVTVAIITGRESAAVSARAAELGIRHLHQGSRSKQDAMHAVLSATGVGADATAAVGDDIPDLAMFAVAGISIAVANAVSEIKNQADLITTRRGGEGAVREIADAILAARQA
ncbi:MAG: HAD hydrolase family protein [Pseudomonadota bacterium]